LLSECDRHFEAKFVNGFTLRNYSNFIIASNYDNIVLVDKDDRRFLCLEVDSKYSGPQTPESKQYFDALRNVDVRHFAHYLYTRDITGWNSRAAPSTEYMRYQKKANFGSVLDFLEDILQKDEGLFEQQLQFKHVVYDLYTTFCEQDGQKYKNTEGERTFWRFLRSAITITDAGQNKNFSAPNRQVRLPTRQTAREMFMHAVKEPAWDWTQ
jgi:hypothetical protein